MKKPKNFGFVADPPESFNREAETTLFLMREVAARGHKVFTLEPKDIFLKQNEVFGMVDGKALPLAKLDCLFLRKDPPFDLPYLYHLWLLAKLEGKVPMINSPTGILRHNEKLSALRFPFAPPTWVGSDPKSFRAWAKKIGGEIVVKPLNSSGGRGVYRLRKTEIKNWKFKLGEPLIAQKYLPEVKNGDKRILLWNGKILGAFLRKPKAGEFRANLHQGGKFVSCTLTARDREIAKQVGGWCKQEGLCFVGLDLIGHYLTEINVTSPMGIREINVLYGKKIEAEIIEQCLNA